MKLFMYLLCNMKNIGSSPKRLTKQVSSCLCEERQKLKTGFFARRGVKIFFLCSYSFDPLGRPTVTVSSDHYFQMSAPTSVRFQNLGKQISSEDSDRFRRYWRDCGSGRVDH